MQRFANAEWKGQVQNGQGQITLESHTLENTPYSFESRMASGSGTNPEELMAASHAGCFAMALSKGLTDAGYTPELLETSCKITLNVEKLEIERSHITVVAKVPGIQTPEFEEIAAAAKSGCPITKALAGVSITLEASLNN
jgi:osmotically inducible protein OsmC